jgi:hypothetical protein
MGEFLKEGWQRHPDGPLPPPGAMVNPGNAIIAEPGLVRISDVCVTEGSICHCVSSADIPILPPPMTLGGVELSGGCDRLPSRTSRLSDEGDARSDLRKEFQYSLGILVLSATECVPLSNIYPSYRVAEETA